MLERNEFGCNQLFCLQDYGDGVVSFQSKCDEKQWLQAEGHAVRMGTKDDHQNQQKNMMFKLDVDYHGLTEILHENLALQAQLDGGLKMSSHNETCQQKWRIINEG